MFGIFANLMDSLKAGKKNHRVRPLLCVETLEDRDLLSVCTWETGLDNSANAGNIVCNAASVANELVATKSVESVSLSNLVTELTPDASAGTTIATVKFAGTPDGDLSFAVFVDGSVSSQFLVQQNEKDQSYGLTLATTLSEGIYTNIVVSATDTTGTVSSANGFTLTVTSVPVVATITLAPTTAMLTQAQTVDAQGVQLATVTLANFDVTPTLTCYEGKSEDASNIFSIVENALVLTSSEQLSEGEYSVTIKANDAAVTAVTFTLTVTSAPVVATITLAPTTATLTQAQTVDAQGVQLATVTLANFDVTPTLTCYEGKSEDASNIFSIVENALVLTSSEQLSEGEYSVTIKANDAAVTAVTFTLTVTSAPVNPLAFVEGYPITELMISQAVGGASIAEFTSTEDKATFSVTVDGKETDAFSIDTKDGNRLVLSSAVTSETTFANIVITATVGDDTYSLDSFDFRVLADVVIDVTDETDYSIFRLDANENSFALIGINGETESVIGSVHSLGNGIVTVIGFSDRSETFIITQAAMQNLSRIFINGNNGVSSGLRDIVTIEGTDDARTFNIGNADGVMGELTGEATSSSPYGSGLVSLEGGASLAFVGAKNFNIESNAEDTFKINGLTASVNINRTNANPKDGGGMLNFSGVQLASTDPGVVLNLGSANHQAVFIGQSGSLRILGGNIQNVVLSQGADTVTGSTEGNTITDTSTSSNVVILKGGNNEVALGGSSTVIAKNGTGNTNNINVNGTHSVVNLTQSTATNTVNITNGDNSVVNGSVGNDNITVAGNYVIVSATQGGNDIVKVTGNNFSVSTGTGNDDITVIGSNGNVSAGAGNDTIRVEDNANGTVSSGNIISGGEDNDFIYAALSSGANIFYANSGNDFIIGGRGNDTIYGNSGNNFLAGGLGKDKVFGGTGRDILVGSLTSNLASMDEVALKGIFDDLQAGWMEDENADIITLLGNTSIRDNQVDNLKGGNDEVIDIFFANSLDQDIDDALENDLVYKG